MKSSATWLAAALVGFATLVTSPEASALEVPSLQGHVNDYARMLSNEDRAALEQKLEAYEQKTGSQFVLLTVAGLEDETLESFGIKVAERWKVGSEKADNGLILLVAPNDRKVRVEVGHGLEGAIPDAIAARVIREVIAPAFRNGQFAQGVNAAFDTLMAAAAGEIAEPVKRKQRTRGIGSLSPILLPIAIFIFFALMGGGGRGRRRRGGFFIFPGGFGGGGGGWGGGGGGGFSGGGGSFGGGGASGEW